MGLQHDAGRRREWKKGRKQTTKIFYKPVFTRALSVMVWGCNSKNGVGRLVVIDGKIDATKYCEIIDENLPSSIQKCFGNKDYPIIL